MAQRQAEKIGQMCDALLAELAKPTRRLSLQQWARVQKLIATREKNLRARSQHVRPVVPKPRPEGLFSHHPWPDHVKAAMAVPPSEAGKETASQARMTSETDARTSDAFDAHGSPRSIQEN